MKLLSVSISGIGPHFNTKVQYGDGFTVIEGQNGAGKTFLLEAAPACFYGRFPSKAKGGKSIYDFMTAADAEIEIEFEISGERYRAVRSMHKATKSQNTKAILQLWRPEEKDWYSLAGPKVSDFNTGIIKVVGPEKTFLASIFASQTGKGDLGTADPQDRREVMGDILNFDLFDSLSEQAKAIANRLKIQIEEKEQFITRDAEKIGELDEMRSRIATSRKALPLVSARIEKARGDLLAIRQEWMTLKASNDEAADVQRQLDEAKNEVARLEKERAKREEQITNLQALINGKERALEAEERLRELKVEEENLTNAALVMGERERINGELEGLREELRKEKKALENLLQSTAGEKELLQEQESCEENLKRKEDLDKSKGEFLKAKAHNDTVGEKIRSLVREIDELKRRSGIIDRVPCSGELQVSCELLNDALKARGKIPDLEERLNKCREETVDLPEYDESEHQQLSDLVSTKNDIPARLEIIRQNKERIPEVEAEIERITQKGKAKRESMPGTVDYDKARHKVVQREIKELRPLAENIERIEAAERDLPGYRTEIETLTQSIKDRQERVNTLISRLQGMDDIITTLQGMEAQIGEIEKKTIPDLTREMDELTRSITRDEARIEDLERLEGEIKKAKTELEALREREESFSTLAVAFGKKGVQPLLIEGERPHLENIANELLEYATEGRFSIRISTQRTNKDGSMAEDFMILINDGERWRDIVTFSGGEKVFLSTILRMAVGIFQSQRSGRPYRSFEVDEPFAALDGNNKPRMLALLRRIHEVHFPQVICVSHSAAIKNGADNRISLNRNLSGVAVSLN